ncbi:MAG: galactose-1-phosphate uridylyltransferase [Ktedonobacterales bacterium]|nr:galactose-1-phosphate uridylyltransferase [Ktedonobacterales bacterium]
MGEDEETAGGASGEATAPGSAASTQLAWNPLMGTYVAQAPARMRRRELTDACPFCADLTSGRVAAGTRAWIRPNDFPALTPPTGECYMLIYHPEHDRTFADLTVEETLEVIALWQRIYRELAPRFACVMTWETSGEAIGQTQRHPHGQTYGVSFLPDTLARELAALDHAEARGRGCLFCAEVTRESGGPRAVIEGAHWLAFVPAYARYPYQVHLAPRHHMRHIADLADDVAATRELATSLLRVVRAYQVLYQGPMPYMLAIHQLGDRRFHLHLELLAVGRAPGRLKLAASTEAAWGLWLNDALPERAAGELRLALAERDHGLS